MLGFCLCISKVLGFHFSFISFCEQGVQGGFWLRTYPPTFSQRCIARTVCREFVRLVRFIEDSSLEVGWNIYRNTTRNTSKPRGSPKSECGLGGGETDSIVIEKMGGLKAAWSGRCLGVFPSTMELP